MIPLNSLNHIPSGATCDDRPLVYGGAVSFDGVDGSFINYDRVSGFNEFYGNFITLSVDSFTRNQYVATFDDRFIRISGDGDYASAGHIYLKRQNFAGRGISDGDVFTLGIFQYEDNGNLKYQVYINNSLINLSVNVGSDVWGRCKDLGTREEISNQFFQGKIYNVVGITYDSSISDFSTINQNLINYNYDGLDIDFFAKLDEMNGTTAFDSSGNSHNGEIKGGVSYINTTEFSFRDNYGYSDGTGIYAGVYIPRDESNIKFDVLGDSLQYKLPSCSLPI